MRSKSHEGERENEHVCHRNIRPDRRGFRGRGRLFNGALMRFKVPGEWSSDAYSLMEVSSSEGRATGLHADPNNETFYVLQGELLFHIDGEEQPLLATLWPSRRARHMP